MRDPRNGNSPKMALWDYIPAITITYLRSVRLLDSIMLYLMGGTASRMWHDIRGRVNIYPVRFLKCPDLQWPLCCPPHIYCRPSNSYPDTLLSSSASKLRYHCLHPASKDSPACIACSELHVFKEGLTIKRVQIINRTKSSELNASSYSGLKSDNWWYRLYHLNHFGWLNIVSIGKIRID